MTFIDTIAILNPSILLYLEIESEEYEVWRSDWCGEGLQVEEVQATTRKEKSLLSRLENNSTAK